MIRFVAKTKTNQTCYIDIMNYANWLYLKFKNIQFSVKRKPVHSVFEMQSAHKINLKLQCIVFQEAN